VKQNTNCNDLTQTEHVYALVLDDNDRALVREYSLPHRSPLNWSTFTVLLSQGADPMKAAQDELLTLGYVCTTWIYLGTYKNQQGQIVHFLFARNTRPASLPPSCNGFHWVGLRDLHYALLDGRIHELGDVASITLALYLMANQIQTAPLPVI